MVTRLHLALPEEALAIATLRTAVAEDLTARYSQGHWSSAVSEKGVLFGMRTSKVFVARDESEVIATLRLARAGGFYQKCGFREVGRVTYRNVPLIYFEMLL